MRLSILLEEIAALGRKYPAAVVALKQRRDFIEQRAIEGRAAGIEIHELLGLNHYLQQPARTMNLYDRLKSAGPRLESTVDVFARLLCDDLLDAGRRDDFATVENRCVWGFALSLATAELQIDFPTSSESRRVRKHYSAKDRALYYYQKLLALGRTDTAAKLKKWILRPQPDAPTYVALIEAALAAKKHDVARALADEARRQLPVGETAKIDEVSKKIPDAGTQ